MFSWFGRKSAPEPVRAFAPGWLAAGGGEGFVRSYDAQFDEVYRRNPVGQRAVRLVAGMLGALPVFAEEGDARAAELAKADGLLYVLADESVPGMSPEGRASRVAAAAYTAGGWRFIEPVDGLSALVKSIGVTAEFVSGAWHIGEVRADRLTIAGQQVVGSQSQAITNPSGGSTVDSEARSAISAMLDALRQHGLIAS